MAKQDVQDFILNLCDLYDEDTNRILPKYENRKKMLLAMEYIARHVNNEDLFYEIWLLDGMPDGDIPFGAFDTDYVEDFYVENDECYERMIGAFLKLMREAYEDGGLIL